MTPTFFPRPSDFRAWLKKHHKTEKELLVGFYKKGSGKESITWPESVDEALCFGWIDGIRRSIDDESYSIRFTPRNPKSNWSAVNIKKVEELTQKGLMQPAGLLSFSLRQEHRSAIYTYENKPKALEPAMEKKFKANKKAWKWFEAQSLSYRKTAFYWIMSAKQESTRLSRLETLIADSEAERIIKPLSYNKKTKKDDGENNCHREKPGA